MERFFCFWAGIFLVAVSLWSLSCSAPVGTEAFQTNMTTGARSRVLNVEVDKDFTADEDASIVEAVYTWNEALGGELRLQITSFEYDAAKQKPDTLYVMRIDSSNPMIPSSDTMAWTSQLGGRSIWVIRDRLPLLSDVEPVIRHEIGHALGSAHECEESGCGRGLMSPNFDFRKYACVDQFSAKQASSYNGLDYSKMKWCVK